MEITTTLKLEVTVIETADETVLPFGTKDKTELEKLLKERIDCDDLHILDTKQFLLDKENAQ